MALQDAKMCVEMKPDFGLCLILGKCCLYLLTNVSMSTARGFARMGNAYFGMKDYTKVRWMDGGGKKRGFLLTAFCPSSCRH